MHHDGQYAPDMEQTPAARLREARIKAGYDSAKAAAEALGVPVATYIQHENGGRGIPPGKASRYAKFFRTSPEWILYARGSSEPVVVEPTLAELPLLPPIQAGAWLALDDTGQDEPTMTAARDPRYGHARQWVRQVQGDSMNERGVNPGDYAQLVEFFGAGVQQGQIVEVTRTRGGDLREITLKEVEITPEGDVLLWPRSSNPRWSQPISLTDGADGDISVEITGILVAIIRRF